MELRQLRTFQMVASSLSFTQASAVLGYAQSSVTAQIQALEAELGVSLFDRLGKRIALTDGGERLLSYAERILALDAEAKLAVPGGPAVSGTLVIGAPETLCAYRLPAVLQAFRLRYPGVRLQIVAETTAELLRRVGAGQVDLAICLEERLQVPGLTVTPVLPEPGYLVAAPDHSLTVLDQVQTGDLLGVQIIAKEPRCPYGAGLERAMIGAGIYPAASLSFTSLEAVKQSVVAGLGVACLPAVAVQSEIDQGRLVALPWAQIQPDLFTQLVYHPGRNLPALRGLLTVIRAVLGNLPASINPVY